MSGIGNDVQMRIVADQVAEAAVEKYALMHPAAAPKVDVPAPLKWAAGIVSAIMSACVVGMCVWGVTTLSSLQQTVTRIDERQQVTGAASADRLRSMEERLSRLERQGSDSAAARDRSDPHE
jgi:hypothetical protein